MTAVVMIRRCPGRPCKAHFGGVLSSSAMGPSAHVCTSRLVFTSGRKAPAQPIGASDVLARRHFAQGDRSDHRRLLKENYGLAEHLLLVPMCGPDAWVEVDDAYCHDGAPAVQLGCQEGDWLATSQRWRSDCRACRPLMGRMATRPLVRLALSSCELGVDRAVASRCSYGSN